MKESVSEHAGRRRAQRRYPEQQQCVKCGAPGERHHADGNTQNNEPGNIHWLCRRCHMVTDGRLSAFAEQAKRRIKTTTAAAAAAKRAMTHCKRGHELSGDNLKPNKAGLRRCRQCETIVAKAYKESKRCQ